MKRKILIFSAVVTLLTGCLNEKNESYTTTDNYFQDVNQIMTGINGCYNSLRNIYSARGFWEMTDVAADLMYTSSSSLYNSNCDVSPARPGIASTVWRYGYAGVKDTNEMTAAIAAAVENGYITEEEAAPLYAETAVLRALYYYLLTSTFGDVPFYAERVTEENRERIATLPRMDAVATRDYCIAELDKWLVREQALPMIRTYEGNEFRAGAAVGYVVAAKMCMWNERWEEAIAFLSKVEDIYGHYADSPSSFGTDYPLTDVPFAKRYVRESIFEMANVVETYGTQTTAMIAACCLPSRVANSVIENALNPDGGADDEYTEEDGEQLEDNSGSDCYAGIRIPELGGNSRTSATARPTTYLYSRLMPYASADLRSGEYSNGANSPRGGSGTLAWRWIGYDPIEDPENTDRKVMFFWSSSSSKSKIKATDRPWMGNKFWAYDMNNTKDPNNYKIFRFADVLLMKAEAHLQMNEYDLACKYLNVTRVRAGLNEVAYVSLGSEPEALMEEIRMERARELVGEFHRKFDLVRWGIWYERTVAYNEGSYLKEYIRPCHRYWPIPADQVAYSGNALDNDEYLE